MDLSLDGGATWLPWGRVGWDVSRGGGLTFPGGIPTDGGGHVIGRGGLTVGLPEPQNPNRVIRAVFSSNEALDTDVTLDFFLTPLLLSSRPPHHSVAFDNTTSATVAYPATSVTTPSFTITSSGNRAGMLAWAQSFSAASVTGVTSTLGGTSGSLISGTDTGAGTGLRSFIHGVIAPGTGSQTGSMSWTNNSNAWLGVVTASGVDQATAFNNGTQTTGSGTSASLSVTSTSGDLTLAEVVCAAVSVSAATQTERWNYGGGPPGVAGSTGSGTGTDSHGWTLSTSNAWNMSGANFLAASGAGGGGAVPFRTLLGVGQ